MNKTFSIFESRYKVYPKSINEVNEDYIFMADTGDKDVLVATGNAASDFMGMIADESGISCKICQLTHENADTLRRLFPFTSPSNVLRKDRTFGVGDRLGIATPGHIRVFNRYDVYPVFAQQSMRELALTNRTYYDVIDSATWAVFREGFRKPWGADGDHLKTFDEIENAIKCGCTMITLDCSEHIHNEILNKSNEEIRRLYQPDKKLEELYLGKTFKAGIYSIDFPHLDFMRTCLIYSDAVNFTIDVWNRFFNGRDDAPDLEMSIDETLSTTLPSQHFFIASELIRHGVKLATLAPRFVGEFQKGIDYIGNPDDFEKDFAVHAAIAKSLGYKISVHSGSDKFSVFSSIGKYTEGHFHLKTAGTNWLTAMEIISEHDPALYRRIHQYALDTAFSEAKKYYHVTPDLNRIPDLATLKDEQLPSLFQNNDSRQLIHITYGLILNKKNSDGTFEFRGRLYHMWRKYAEEYYQKLDEHIGKHVEKLYEGFSNQPV